MRTTFLLITVLSALPVIALAQTPPVSTSTNKPAQPGDARLQQTLPKPADSDAEFQMRYQAKPTTEPVTRLELEGALVRATQAGQPWQVVNPFAPKEFGDGLDNVSVEPRTGKAAGVVLLSIRFGKMGHSRK